MDAYARSYTYRIIALRLQQLSSMLVFATSFTQLYYALANIYRV
jgi:hypothetical protein